MKSSGLLIKLSLFFVVFNLLVSCSKTHQLDEKQADNFEDIYSSINPTGHPIFPHGDNWAEPQEHGVWTLTSVSGYSECFTCHDKESQSTLSNPVGCKSCHSVYPHIEGWKDGPIHGVYVLNNGEKDCATQCHGTDLLGGDTKVGCKTCHEVFPHPENWNHGGYVMENGTNACKTCHGVDLSGGDTGVSCKKCHTTYPHEVGFGDKSRHGKTVLDSTATECKMCHGADLTGGNAKVSCHRCHSVYPHTPATIPLNGLKTDKEFKDIQNHGELAKFNGFYLCKGCHAEDGSGGNTGKSCDDSNCHATGVYRKKHQSETWITDHQLSDSETCATLCHGKDLKGGFSGVSCLTGCHNVPYPHPEGFTDQVSEAFHGKYSKAACTNCHGMDFKGTETATSCYDCHSWYPHLSDNFLSQNDNRDKDGDDDDEWVADGRDNLHASAFIALAKDNNLSECQRCHGENFDQKTGGQNCLNCHTKGITHINGWAAGTRSADPEGLKPWGKGEGHGQFFSLNFRATSKDENCGKCHGAFVNFTDTRVADYRSYACTNCHYFTERFSDQTRDSLTEDSDCFACHWTYPHKEYQAYTAEGEMSINASWGPQVPTIEGQEHGFYYGHVYYLARHPLLVDSSGAQHTGDIRNQTANGRDAVINSCAGTSAGMCHYNGYRSDYHPEANRQMCGQYCHPYR